MKPSIEERMFGKCIIADRGCWEWQGAVVGNRGYGVMCVTLPGFRKRMCLVHRVAGWLFNGWDLFDDLMTCHHCDNPKCFNPKHLYQGTNSQNITDAVKRMGHADWPNTQRKLHAAEVLYIRKLHLLGTSQPQLSRKFYVSSATICCIVNHKIWKGVA